MVCFKSAADLRSTFLLVIWFVGFLSYTVAVGLFAIHTSLYSPTFIRSAITTVFSVGGVTHTVNDFG